MSCSFFNLVSLSSRINLEHNVLGSISFMYAIETSSTVLVFKATVIR